MCVSTLRLIRPASEAPVVEVMKEFFFLTGCLLCDKPVHSLKDAEEELRKGGGTDIDIVLNLNVFYWEDGLPKWSGDAQVYESAWFKQEWADSSIGNSGFAIRNDRRVFVTYQQPKRKKMKFYRKLIDRLIFQIWNSDEDALQREQLFILNRLYFEHHLLGFLQSKRALRMMNMGEALELNLGQQTISADCYIRDMLLAFNRFYQDTVELQRETRVSPYTRYANINIARKIREVFQLLEKKPAAKWSEDGGFPSVTYCSAGFLLEALGKLYRQEPQYPGTLFLAARVCQSEPSQEQNAGYYYQKLFETIAGKDKRAYSFIYYEYGRYIERTERNWRRALRYFAKSAHLTPLSYQAFFKMGCCEAKNREFDTAQIYFKNAIRIIWREFSGGRPIAWENLSLPCIQYLFKTYMWMWKICLSLAKYSEAQAYLGKAWNAAEAYRENQCLRRAYNPKSGHWKALESYHKNSRPVLLLREIVRSSLASTSMFIP